MLARCAWRTKKLWITFFSDVELRKLFGCQRLVGLTVAGPFPKPVVSSSKLGICTFAQIEVKLQGGSPSWQF